MPHEMTSIVTDNIHVARETFALHLRAPSIAQCAMPGQFAMLGIRGNFLRRPLSIAGTDGENVIFLVRIVGEGTAKLGDLRKGEKVQMLAPLGNNLPHDVLNPLLVGGGIGIAPIVFAANWMAQKNLRAKVLYGERTREYLIAERYLPPDTSIATDDGGAGFHGTVTELLAQQEHSDIFACGPNAMLDAVAQTARRWHVRAWLSLETHMACGFGVCQGCVVKTKKGYMRVCTDGPIFPADIIFP